jgi:serine/threonine-protein kinase HipA
MGKRSNPTAIEVCAHWEGLKDPIKMGTLYASLGRGKEVFSFEYESDWLKGGLAQVLDPSLQLFTGPQYAPTDQDNFGLFLDSAPDRWGRQLMKRREEQVARAEGRDKRLLLESDFLLGVFDGSRMGGLRFRKDPYGPFLDDNASHASPPWTSIRELEHASLEIEKENAEKNPEYAKWLRMLIAPGASLGGARPKAGVRDAKGALWIAKFPSRLDDQDVGGWEAVIHRLAKASNLDIAEAQWRKFSSKHHTFMTKRFDRTISDKRVHFASAMTLLSHHDGDDADAGVSYLEFIDFIMKNGAQPNHDLEELWKRIVFYVCVSNVDDHLRNHGFILEKKGWRLSPAYDVNPVATGNGLKLNISESDNEQSLDLARSVAKQFRVSDKRAEEIIAHTRKEVQKWKKIADALNISKSEQDQMSNAFRIADERPR